MSQYLEEAANLLRKSAATNEQTHATYSSALMDGRERIARQFAALAAIDKGLLPADTARDVLDSITEAHT